MDSDDSRVSRISGALTLLVAQQERIVGRRLRVEGQKRTEVEYRQMLRLCEIEN